MNAMKVLLVLFLLIYSLIIQAQPTTSNANTPLDKNDDDFNDSASLKNWQFFHSAEQFPDKIRSMKISNGIMQLQPYASGWYGDFQAPFMFKTISGDFDVRARVKVSGTNSELPQSEWSLAGLMIRQPKKTTSATWQAREENWLFLTTGIAQPKGVPVFEVKTTNNSMSNLKLRPAESGWVELRAVRVQASFLLMYRYNNDQPWTIIERFYRPLLPYELQVGLNAYSGWNEIPREMQQDVVLNNTKLDKAIPADLVFHVDFIRFQHPKLQMEKLQSYVKGNFRVPYYTPSNLLTDYSITNEMVLEIVGN